MVLEEKPVGPCTLHHITFMLFQNIVGTVQRRSGKSVASPTEGLYWWLCFFWNEKKTSGIYLMDLACARLSISLSFFLIPILSLIIPFILRSLADWPIEARPCVCTSTIWRNTGFISANHCWTRYADYSSSHTYTYTHTHTHTSTHTSTHACSYTPCVTFFDIDSTTI